MSLCPPNSWGTQWPRSSRRQASGPGGKSLLSLSSASRASDPPRGPGSDTFHSVLEAQVVIDEWNLLDNTRRHHRGLSGMTRRPTARAPFAHER